MGRGGPGLGQLPTWEWTCVCCSRLTAWPKVLPQTSQAKGRVPLWERRTCTSSPCGVENTCGQGAEREATRSCGEGDGPGVPRPPPPLHTQAQMGIRQEKHRSADSAGLCCVSWEGPFPSLWLGFLSRKCGPWEHVKGPSRPWLETE